MVIIEAYRDVWKKYQYIMFDQYTDSCRRADEEEVTELIDRGLGFCNIQKNYGSLYVDNGYNRIERFSSDGKVQVVLANICDEQFKITNAYANTDYIGIEELTKLATNNLLYNCRNNNGNLEFIDKCILNTTKEFRDSIDDKYKRFIAKSRMMGLDSSFKGLVEGDNVILKDYTGESKKFIVPSFITSISSEAFQYSNMRSIELNDGLKYIGANAFAGCQLASINIPESVKHIWINAFEDNEKLFASRSTRRLSRETLDESKVAIGNKDVIFL